MTPTAPIATPSTSSTPAPADGSPLGQWLGADKNRYVALGGAVLVIAAIVAFVLWWGSKKDESGMRALDQARSTAEAGNLPLAASQLQQVITQYGGTNAAAEATISLNQVRLINGQAELAVNGLKDFIKSNPPARYVGTAQAMLGTALENTRKPGDAAAAFVTASQMADLPMLKADYLLNAGRAFANAGKKDEAIKVYRRITTEFKDQPASTEAQVRLAELTNGLM